MPPPTVAVGWTPSTYIMLAVLLTLISGFTAVAIIWMKNKPQMVANAHKADQSLRAELLGMLNTAETRHANEISSLRQAHGEEIQSMREDMEARDLRCERENRSLKDQVKALQQMIISFQISSGQPFSLSLPPATKKMVDKIIEAMNDEDGEAKLSIIAEALDWGKRHD